MWCNSIFSRTHDDTRAESQWRRKVVKRCCNVVSFEFFWIRIGNVTISSCTLTLACCLIVGLRFIIGIRFRVWLVSGYAHVFVLLSVVTVTLPDTRWRCRFVPTSGMFSCEEDCTVTVTNVRVETGAMHLLMQKTVRWIPVDSLSIYAYAAIEWS